MLWKSLISKAFKTKTNSLHPITQCQGDRKRIPVAHIEKKKGFDLFLLYIGIAPIVLESSPDF